MFQHTSAIESLNVEGYPNMPRNSSEAVPQGNGLVPRQEELGPDQPMLVDAYRRFEEIFNRQLKIMKSRIGQQDKKLDEMMEEMKETDQR